MVALSLPVYRISAVERDLFTLTSRPGIKEEAAEAFDPATAKVAADLRTREAKAAATQGERVKDNLDKLKATLLKDGRSPTYVQEVKTLMETIEADLVQLKQDEREKMEKLTLEEKRLISDLSTMEQRIASWDRKDDTAVTSVGDHGKADARGAENRHRADPDKVLPEVIAFQDYLVKHGGHYGGWDDLSHAGFLKLRTRYGANNPNFLPSCVSGIPGISLSEAAAHEDWYRKFAHLLEAKKAAIALWKKRKSEQAIQAQAMIDQSAVSEKERSEKEREREHQKREELRREIQRWKDEQKAREKAAAELTVEEKQRQHEQQKRWRAEQAKLKGQVAEYVRTRTQQEVMQRKLQEEAERVRRKVVTDMAQEELKRFNQRDSEIICKKREKEEMRIKMEQEKEERLAKLRSQSEAFGVLTAASANAQVAVTIERDPARLLKPTQGLQSRLSAPKWDDTELAQRKFMTTPIPKRSDAKYAGMCQHGDGDFNSKA
ncbi:hypothetical protein HK101_001089 [Irineochytrium annulatum]|nr:hypothetical protein HK101_001089 [Irineochytrium annulatum]